MTDLLLAAIYKELCQINTKLDLLVPNEKEINLTIDGDKIFEAMEKELDRQVKSQNT